MNRETHDAWVEARVKEVCEVWSTESLAALIRAAEMMPPGCPIATLERIAKAAVAARREMLIASISDAHKDAYGWRPFGWELEAKNEAELEEIARNLSAGVVR